MAVSSLYKNFVIKETDENFDKFLKAFKEAKPYVKKTDIDFTVKK